MTASALRCSFSTQKRACAEPTLPESVAAVVAISPVLDPDHTLRALEQVRLSTVGSLRGDLTAALEHMRKNRHFGKIVLNLD